MRKKLKQQLDLVEKEVKCFLSLTSILLKVICNAYDLRQINLIANFLAVWQ